MGNAQFLWGLSSGILVLGVSGGFWWGLALGSPAATAGRAALAAVIAVQVGGVICFAYLARVLRRRLGFRRASLNREDPETRRLFRGFRPAAPAAGTAFP